MNINNDKEENSELPYNQDLEGEPTIENTDQLILLKINQREEENQALKKILDNLNKASFNTKKNLKK